MTSFVDLERCRTNYFDSAVDAVEPSSSPSEGSLSLIRALRKDPVAGVASTPPSTSSNAADRDPVSNGDDRFRKGHRPHARDSNASKKKLSSLLILTSERLDKETRRANDAERRTLEAITLARSENEAKLIAQRDATRANEELKLYKLQYDNAQKEIFKAQELIDQIEAERQEAEAAAARARSTARKLKEQNLIIMAREEGRQVGYQEGLATGRMMAYEERTRAGDSTDEPDFDDEVILQERPSNIRLRSSTPGTGSRPSSRPPGARQPPPTPPPYMRPPSRSTHVNFGSVPHPSTPVGPPQPTQVGPPTPIRLMATPPPKISMRSKLDPSSHPPDNWIPFSDDQSHIAVPPPHQMSPSLNSVTLEPQVHVQGSAPVPPPPVIDRDFPVERSTASETSSETLPTKPAEVHTKDHLYRSLKLRGRDGLPQRSRPPTPLSPGSTRMSDYWILTSPQANGRKLPLPNEARHFEIERSSTPARENAGRGWSLRRKTEVVPARVGVSPAPVPPPVTEHIVVAPQPVRPGKSPLSRMSSSSSSSASTTTARHSSSIHSSPGRTKLDPRMDSSSGGDSRSHYSRLFKKRKDQLNEEGTASNISMRIEIESPSESDVPLDEDGIPPEHPPQPSLLSPSYKPGVLPRDPSASTPKTTGGNQNLPPLAELKNLISPGYVGSPIKVPSIPPGFVADGSLVDQVQEGDRGDGQPSERSVSTRTKRKVVGPGYEVASSTSGVRYPNHPPGADVPRSKSRASRSSRQGQVPGSLDTP